jgi:hypothetical protein
MIVEAVESLLTHCPSRWRRLGYAYAAVACSARARRRTAAWAPHQQRTRSAILAAAARCAQKRTVLILGSGPLNDVPLIDLLAQFQRVILADVAHPPAARMAARRWPAVSLATVELTGLSGPLLDPVGEHPPVPAVSAAFLDQADIDLVVSCNLASQLPLIPLARASRRWPSLDEEALGHAIVAAHLAHLRRFRGEVLLICDVVRAVFDPSGGLERQDDPLYGVPLPEGEEWEWDLAPPGELSSGHSVMTRVRAVRLSEPAKAATSAESHCVGTEPGVESPDR